MSIKSHRKNLYKQFREYLKWVSESITKVLIFLKESDQYIFKNLNSVSSSKLDIVFVVFYLSKRLFC
jgi:pheromone shutdown protein TraB